MKTYNVQLHSKSIVTSWWGELWCKNLNVYADYPYRLERGRVYLRNNRVHEITIEQGELIKVHSMVDGSSETPYDVVIYFSPLNSIKANEIIEKIVGLNDFKKGVVPEDYRFLFSIDKEGLFPSVDDIKVECSCPDFASFCKHVAAVLFAIGSIIDQDPLVLFYLRGIDVDSYLDGDVEEKVLELLAHVDTKGKTDRVIDNNLISEVFGIEMIEPIKEEFNTDLVYEAEKKITEIHVGREKNYQPPIIRDVSYTFDMPVGENRFVIRQYSYDGTYITQYDSYDDAESQTGIDKHLIAESITGRSKIVEGYIWKKERVDSKIHNVKPVVIADKKENNKKEKVLLPDRLIIRQFGLDGNFIAQFETYDEASEATGVPKRAMQRNVCGEKKSGGGYIWKKVPANTRRINTSPVDYSNNAYRKKKPKSQTDIKESIFEKKEDVDANEDTNVYEYVEKPIQSESTASEYVNELEYDSGCLKNGIEIQHTEEKDTHVESISDNIENEYLHTEESVQAVIDNDEYDDTLCIGNDEKERDIIDLLNPDDTDSSCTSDSVTDKVDSAVVGSDVRHGIKEFIASLFKRNKR